jgi:hypothetical protein
MEGRILTTAVAAAVIYFTIKGIFVFLTGVNVLCCGGKEY